MSKIRELMKEVAEKHMHEGLWEFHSQATFEGFSKELEQAIKAEIMGLDRYRLDYDHDFEKNKEGNIVMASKLENLFSEVESDT